MGAGDQFMRPKFSVGMPGGDKWPFEKREEIGPESRGACGECGADAVIGSAHTDARDEDRPRKRVCFGKVVTR